MKKNKSIKILIILAATILITIFIGYGYSKYVTSIKGETKAQIASWNFKVNGSSSQMEKINLADTIIEDTTTENAEKGYVLPGTKGCFNIQVDASGSEVSLLYNIDIDVSNIPENLKFYSDKDMKNRVIVTDNKIKIEDFIGLNDVKNQVKTVYWQWKLETGVSQDEIDANDVLDSKWIDGEILLEIEATGRQVTDDSVKQYDVTFDLNGGSLANYDGAGKVTKKVSYGDVYGELPMPTRKGYRFVGWNGKNLVNMEDHNVNFTALYYDEKEAKPKYILKPDTTYTLSFDYKINSSTMNILSSVGYGDVGYFYDIIYTDYYLGTGRKEITFKTSSKFAYDPPYVWFRFVRMYSRGDANVDISNIQFEENDTATLYEPYIISSLTPITQNKNHKLTAIWEEI